MPIGIACEACGVRNELHERFCAGCGQPIGGRISLPQASASMVKSGAVIRTRGIDWRWVLLGTLVTIGICSLTMVGMLLIATPSAVRSFDHAADGSDALTSFLLTLGCGFLLGFFLGGVVIGKLSRGRTILEPALSALLAVTILALVSGALEQGATGVLCTAPVLGLLSLAGGWLGEKWQGRTEEPRSLD